MKSVGEKLRQERIRQGLDLAALADLTRISKPYLEAIEAGDPKRLPSGFFYRSFVRQYASAVSLDPAEIESDLERVRQSEAPVLTAALHKAEFPIKAQDPIVSESNRRYLGTGRTWTYVVLLVAMLVGCSAFYEWWKGIETASAARSAGIPERPQSSERASEPAASAPRVEHRPVPPSNRAQSVAVPSAAPVPTLHSAQPENSAVRPEAAAPPSKTPALSGEDRVVVSLSATEVTWVSVASDGKSVFSGLMQPNQSMTLGGRERTQLKIGNAGGLAVSWNGKTIGPVGPKGQVRTVLMTPESYRIIVPDGSL